MTRPTLRQAFEENIPLVTPLAHDALSARLIEQAGFSAFTVGGSALLAARHAYPDIGLIGLTDMVDGLRDIAAASTLPFMADADDGYGDLKSVARTVWAYEAIGVGGFLIEDQDRDRKQQRADKAAAVVEESLIEEKLRVALSVRGSADTLVIGRTDAYGVLGLDAALRRAERFLSLGVDGVFIAGLRSEEDYAKVGRTLNGALLSAAMFEGGDTPWLTPQVLAEMGFRHVSYPTTLMFRLVQTMTQTLDDLRALVDGNKEFVRLGRDSPARRLMDVAVDLDRWRGLETQRNKDG